MTRDLTRFWIGGEWVEPLSEERLDVEDPATEEIVARIALGSAEDVDRAVAAARAAQPGWAATPVGERVAFLDRLLEVTKRRLPDLADAITTEMGAPHDVSLGEQAATAVGHLEGFLTALEDFPWEERLPNGETLWREPVGVAGLITPWNWPINQITLKVLPAIATGCACVLKPSELTPLSAMLYAEILAEAGLPGGVVNLVNGTGPVVGAALSGHPGIDMMSFTGSTRAGAQVSRDASESVKRVTLELGGKGPNLVFADCGADLEERVRASVAEGMLNSGQSCDQPARMIVEASVYEEVCRIAAAAAQETVVGDPRERRRPDRAAGPCRAMVPGAGVHRGRRGRGRAPDRRRGRAARGAEPRPLRPAHDLRRRDARHDDLARGGLRPGPDDHPLRGRGGGAAARQRHRIRARGLRPDRGEGPRPAGGAGLARRHGAGERRGDGGGQPLRRHEAVGQRARGRPARAWRISPRPRR